MGFTKTPGREAERGREKKREAERRRERETQRRERERERVLTEDTGKKRWVFKAPAHANFLHSLLKVYPGFFFFLFKFFQCCLLSFKTRSHLPPLPLPVDARIVLTQRHPLKIAGSVASLRTTTQQVFWDPIDFSDKNRNTPLKYLPNCKFLFLFILIFF